MDSNTHEKFVEAARILEYATIENFSIEDFPEKNDIIFRTDREYGELTACLGFANDEISIYAAGYLHAARLLTQSVCLTKRKMDTLIYPIVFLYRHYVELTLKNLIIRGECFTYVQLNSKVKEKALRNHDLNELWQCLKPIFYELWSEIENIQKIMEGVESYIGQITKIDKNSFSFRYSQTKDRKKRNLDGIQHINIPVFSEYMERLVMVLEGCDQHLDFLSNSLAIERE